MSMRLTKFRQWISTTIFIKGLPPECTTAVLRDNLEVQFGAIRHAIIFKQPDNIQKANAMVDFCELDSALVGEVCQYFIFICWRMLMNPICDYFHSVLSFSLSNCALFLSCVIIIHISLTANSDFSHPLRPLKTNQIKTGLWRSELMSSFRCARKGETLKILKQGLRVGSQKNGQHPRFPTSRGMRRLSEVGVNK